ncbi:sugar ABC transporter permease [Paenibacillus sonchi]|uniref:Sugar ABC transporter permease n=2 Tax=Paenibacillus sonchi group TaxID=2044880 RepID=A0A974SC89_9BACL|nr:MULTISPECIES: sugar ABC transporter permease [Paenibacillus sonchi group]MCE3201432.1 sugar ABC transporter permease [Paenibacillus sonchi]QQZ60114.1 sugar ABC transporter permease [Paenibacillus sonchi]CQR56361.1 sugar ABC transporter permease [Paenibacillus riograndensis SBR5]
MKIKKWRADAQALLFLLPFLIVYGLFTIWPMFKGVEMTFYKWTLIRKMDFLGWDNYSKVLQDREVWEALGHSLIFVVLTTPTMLVLSISLALIANRKSMLQKFYRSIFFIPSVLSVAVASYLGLFVFQPYTGLVNSVLHLIHLLPGGTEIFWLTETRLAWIAITLITLWWTVGFNFILHLSAIQEIPDEIYEAARLDGAGDRQMFWRITLPYLAPITKTITMLQIIASFKVFMQIYIVTGGGPLDSTRPIIQLIYQTGFKSNDLGYAATMSYLLFVILLVLSALQYWMNNRKGAEL